VFGDATALGVREQERVAADFIAAHREALRALARHPGVDNGVLALQYHLPQKRPGIPPRPRGRRFCVCPSPEVLRAALDVDIRPVVYVTIAGPAPSE